MYCDLHIHTEYTRNNSIIKIEPLIKKAKKDKMEYLGIADSGNISGVLEFYKQCIENNIKPIIGCGFYFTFLSRFDKEESKNHIVLIAKNNNGVKNIAQMVKLSYEEGYYKKPRIDKELLEKYADDLILFTGGLGGPIDKILLNEKRSKAERIIDYFVDVFSKENMYLEIQDNGLENNKIVSEKIIEIANEKKIQLVTSGGSFYLNKDEMNICNKLRMKNNNKELKGNYHFKLKKEIKNSLIIPKIAIANTYKIAKKVNVKLNMEEIEKKINKKYRNINNQKRADEILEMLK